MSIFTTHEIGAEKYGRQTVSVIRSDYSCGAPSDFTVLIFDEVEGYVYSETFEKKADAVKRYREKAVELRSADSEGTGV